VGVLELGIDTLPRNPLAIRAVTAHIRNWFGEMRILLEGGHELAEVLLHYLTQLSMTEIDLMEKRVSRLATIIDPYDVRGMARLLPVLSRHDQDIGSPILQFPEGHDQPVYSCHPHIEERPGFTSHFDGDDPRLLDDPAPVIGLSLMRRFRSQKQDSFSDKVVAALRREFGGHAVVAADK